MTTVRILRVVFGLALAGAAMAALAQSAADPKALVGTWKLVSATYDGKVQKATPGHTRLKHVTPSAMIWVDHDAKGKVLQTAGGVYTWNGSTYTETIQYGVGSSYEFIKGQSHAFEDKLDGDRWIHKGKLARGMQIEEVWQRVDGK